MMRNLLILFCLFVAFNLLAQDKTTATKITLKSGAVYIGEVVLRNDEIMMLKNKGGERFQFQLSDIVSEESVSEEQIQNEVSIQQPEQTGNFCGIIESALFSASARNAFERTTGTQFSISFGNKKAFGRDIFTGFGVGYLTLINYPSSNSPTLIPFSFKILIKAGKNHIAPQFGAESGYAISINENVKGGFFATVSTGLLIPLNEKTALYTSVYGAAYTLKGNLSENTEGGTFIYNGTTTMNLLGVKIGLRF